MDSVTGGMIHMQTCSVGGRTPGRHRCSILATSHCRSADGARPLCLLRLPTKPFGDGDGDSFDGAARCDRAGR